MLKNEERGTLMIYYLLALFLASLVLIKLVIRELRMKQKNEKGEKSQSEQKRTWISDLHKLERFDIEGYAGETKEKLKELLQKALTLSEEIFEQKEEEKKSFEMFKEQYEAVMAEEKEMLASLEKAFQEWDALQKEIEETIAYATEFFVGTNFFPPEFINDTHRLERMLSEIKEEKRQNPLSDPTPYQDENQNLLSKIEAFKEEGLKTADATLKAFTAVTTKSKVVVAK